MMHMFMSKMAITYIEIVQVIRNYISHVNIEICENQVGSVIGANMENLYFQIEKTNNPIQGAMDSKDSNCPY